MNLAFKDSTLHKQWKQKESIIKKQSNRQHKILGIQKFLIENVAVHISQLEQRIKQYFNELLITGKILEKIYINSTDIEFA